MKTIFTTFEIARLCNVDITTVINWIESGKLIAYKTPGGHRRVNLNEFLSFLKNYNFPIPRGITGRGESVVIVDDDPEVRQLVATALTVKMPGIEILEAGEGFTAGKLIAEKHPSLIILDIRLPGNNGIDICRSIKTDRRLKHSKILAITAYHNPDVQKNMLDAGADAYMTKPLDLVEFGRTVERLLPLTAV